MFLFLRKKDFLKKAAFTGLFLVLLTGILFISCSDDDPFRNTVPSFNVPVALQNTWLSEYDEEFIITATDFTYSYDGDTVYAGTIVNHRADGSGAGYITIQYTEAVYQSPDSIGNYYVIHYKDLTATTMSISGASNLSYEGGEGKATIAEAEATFTVAGGYFTYYSDVTTEKQGGTVTVQIPAGLNGYFQANGTDVLTMNNYAMDFSTYEYNNSFWFDSFYVNAATKKFYYYGDTTFETYWGGDVAAVVPDPSNPDNSGVLIILLTEVEGDWWTEPETGKYFAFAYQNLAVSGADVLVSGSQPYKNDGYNTGIVTLEDAISEYTVANSYYGLFGGYGKSALSSPAALAGIQGTWAWEDYEDYLFVINGSAFIEFLDDDDPADGIYEPYGDDYLAVIGFIVDCTDTTQASGIFYIQVIDFESYSFSNQGYAAVAWRNRSGNGIEFAIGQTGYGSLAQAKTNYNDVTNTSQFPDSSFYAAEKQ